MAICVTEQMIDAAQAHLSGVWNRARIRRALEAATALVPDAETVAPVNVRLRLQVDEQQLRADAAAALRPYQDEIDHPMRYLPLLPIALSNEERAEFEKELARAAAGPIQILHSPQPTMTVTEPVLNPALDRPLELGTLTDLGRRIGVARSTITGWVKNRERNGMPLPVDGDAYDLRALTDWHRAWKAAG